MAEKRMFTMKIVDSDAFLDMPLSTQALYFHLNMRADDDGFVNNPKKIQRTIGATEDDLKLLLAKRFLLSFENGVIVIKHWRMHNLLRKDRYKPTQYQDEIHMLSVKENGAYTELATKRQQVVAERLPSGCQVVAERLPQDRIGKDRLDKDRIGEDSKGEVSIEDVCTEPLTSSEPETDLDAPAIILNDGSEWRPTVADINEWRKFYTGIDVVRELGRMRQWCISNPSKRKTPRGVRRFVTNWLDSEQNRQGKYSRSGQNQKDKYTQRMEDMQNWGRQFESNNQS